MVDFGLVHGGGRPMSQGAVAGGRCIAAGAFALLLGAPLVLAPLRPAHADNAPAAPIPLELNKLEPVPAPAPAAGAAAAAPGCRLYMVVTNPDADPIAQLRLDLMLFGSDGVIARRVALDLAPLAAHKTAVRLFDVAGQPCDGIARVLVNDVLVCQTGKQESGAAEQAPQMCLDRLQVSARGKVDLTK